MVFGASVVRVLKVSSRASHQAASTLGHEVDLLLKKLCMILHRKKSISLVCEI
jgi:hypothetical protein